MQRMCTAKLLKYRRGHEKHRVAFAAVRKVLVYLATLNYGYNSRYQNKPRDMCSATGPVRLRLQLRLRLRVLHLEHGSQQSVTPRGCHRHQLRVKSLPAAGITDPSLRDGPPAHRSAVEHRSPGSLSAKTAGLKEAFTRLMGFHGNSPEQPPAGLQGMEGAWAFRRRAIAAYSLYSLHGE